MKVSIKPYNPNAEWRDPFGEPHGATCVVVAKGLEGGKPVEIHVLCRQEEVDKYMEDFKLYAGWLTVGYTIQKYLELNIGYLVATFD